MKMVTLILTVFLAFFLKNIKSLQLQNSTISGDISLPSNFFDITDLFNIYYEFQPPGFITMVLRFNIPGQYFAIGFGTGMIGADIWVFELIDNEIVVSDRYGLDDGYPPNDTELGGTDNVERLGYEITTNYSLVKVRRLLDTGDRYDTTLIEGPISGIYATGPSPIMVFHGDDDGVTVFPFRTFSGLPQVKETLQALKTQQAIVRPSNKRKSSCRKTVDKKRGMVRKL